MKLKTFLFAVYLHLFTLVSFGQTKATLYKASQWADVKGKGSFGKAMDNPTKEKAEVLLTIKNIKVTLGVKTYVYKLVSFYRYSAVQWRYSVILDGKNYEISISEHSPENYSIIIDKEWAIYPITDVSAVETK